MKEEGSAEPRTTNDKRPATTLLQYHSSMLPALIGLAAAAAASAAGYQSMAPTGQWLGRTLASGTPGSRQLALTFDDGPNDPHTLRLLEVLAGHGVSATFFMIGRYVRERPDIARAVAAAGHVIGNHTFTHPLLIFQSGAQTRVELTSCRQALEDAIGGHSNLFRPPFGGRRPATLRIARELGLKTVMWNVTGYDWEAPPAAVIEAKVARQIRAEGGDVILLHDGGHKAMGADRAQTVIATDNLIRRYKEQGFEFVTVPQWMTLGNPKLMVEMFPSLSTELQQLLAEKGEPELAAQVPELTVIGRCRCGDDFCGTFYVLPKPDGAYGPDHRNVELSPKNGMLILDVLANRIAAIEVLYRDEIRRRLLVEFP